MAGNHFCLFHCHHLHQHGSRVFPFFDFDNTKFVANRIKVLTRYAMNKIKVKMKKVKVARNKKFEEEK